MVKRFATSTVHALSYYRGLLSCVGQGLIAGKRHKEIVAELRQAKIPSPVGIEFTETTLAQLLKGLRNPDAYPSNAFNAMLRLYYDGELSRALCRTLQTTRAGTLA